ncbi:MAG: DUF1018 domain-containing protein [Deltaproteobacteria bacterium]|nr:DUF1018 domain-containing protein [Deltaproteobacteria bacterium]
MERKTSIKEGITGEQLKKIWSIRSQKGISEDWLRDVVESVSGQRSTRALTKRQAVKVIDALDNGQRKWTVYRQDKEPEEIIFSSKDQLALIDHLKTEAGWSDERLMNFIKKVYKRDGLKKLRVKEAGIVIHVLEKAKLKKKGVA